MCGLPSILSLFHNEFNKFNETGARMLDFYLSYNFKIALKSQFGVKTSRCCHYVRNFVMDVFQFFGITITYK